MAKMNGCNDGISAPSGAYAKRMDPNTFARNNMSKGGVNKHAGGLDSKDSGGKPALAAGSNGIGKYHHNKK